MASEMRQVRDAAAALHDSGHAPNRGVALSMLKTAISRLGITLKLDASGTDWIISQEDLQRAINHISNTKERAGTSANI